MKIIKLLWFVLMASVFVLGSCSEDESVEQDSQIDEKEDNGKVDENDEKDEDNEEGDQPTLVLSFSRDNNQLIADFKGIDTTTYHWRITGEVLQADSIVENDGVGHEGDNVFNLDNLEPGTYEACIIANIQGKTKPATFCKEVKIEEEDKTLCKALSFNKEVGIGGTFLLVENPQSVAYNWTVDGELIKDYPEHGITLNQFLEAGKTYEICVFSEDANCPNGNKSCETIKVEAPQSQCDIFNLININNSIVSSRTYGILDINPGDIEWTIDGKTIVLADELKRSINLGEFVQRPGNYKICITANSQECGELSDCLTVAFEQ